MAMRVGRIEQQMTQNEITQQSRHSETKGLINKRTRVLNNNIRSYGATIQGALLMQANNDPRQRLRRLDEDPGGDDMELDDPSATDETATLAPHPRTLEMLWREWTHGIEGRKAASQFTMDHRNRSNKVKQAFYRRKIFWEVVARMVRGGVNHQVAINRIREVHGHTTSVTKTLVAMKKDKQRGGHPNL